MEEDYMAGLKDFFTTHGESAPELWTSSRKQEVE
jgi:hypothetical protein